MTATQVEARPVRRILREFIESVIEDEDEIITQEIIAYATERFKDDEEFLHAAARDVLSVMIPDVVGDIVRSQRHDLIKTPRGAVRNRKIERTARERFSMIRESIGEGRYKSLLTATRNDLILVNEREGKEIHTRQKWFGFRAEMISKMDARKTVGETFSGVQLEDLWRRHLAEQDTPE